MTADNIIGTKIKAYCSKCRGERNCDIAGHHQESGEEGDGEYMWNTNWYLLVCCGCEYVFAQSVSTNSEDYSNYYNRLGDTETEYHETVKTWPARAKRTRPEWFEHGGVESAMETAALDASLNELYGALDHDLFVLSSIGIRTSFDIAAELLGIDPSMRFEDKVADLVAKGLIKESEKEHIDVLVDAGSASAHRGWQPRIDDLAVLMGILEDFIYNNMVLPTRKQAEAEKLAKVKAKVPKRAKAAGKSKKPPAAAEAASASPSSKTPI
nr:DUF4145 domain-containing protein [uncultured Shinella sp.]